MKVQSDDCNEAMNTTEDGRGVHGISSADARRLSY